MTPDPSDVQALFARHYFYFAMLAALGALQIAVSMGGYRGMWLLPGRLMTRFTGGVLIGAGVALFFLLPLWVDGPWAAGSVEADSSTRIWGKADWEDLGAARNVNDVDGGLSGTGQATWFPLSAFIAIVVSIAAGTANHRLFPGRMAPAARDRSDPAEPEADGIARMASGTYRTALAPSWRKFRRDLPSDAGALLTRSDRWSISVRVWEAFRK